MVVENSDSMRELISFTLRTKGGYHVIEATDGRDALEKINDAKAKMDMVITDIHMPGMDGIELTRQLKSKTDSRYLPIVLLTTETNEDKKKEGKSAGATAWITKPFKQEQLISVVKRILG